MSNYKRHQHTVKKKNSNVNVMHYKMSTYNGHAELLYKRHLMNCMFYVCLLFR